MSIEPQPERSEPSPYGARCDLDVVAFRDVRGLVREALAGRDDVTADDAVLVADELVSNAHRHGASPRYCHVALVDDGRRLLIEVDDASPRLPRKRTPDHTGGRGLVLVDQLATEWGVDHYDGHKTVWAEFVLDRPAASGGKVPHLALAPRAPDPSSD